MNTPSRDFRPAAPWMWISLLLVWLMARLLPWLHAIPWSYWEIWETRKLLEYGFFARKGALLDIHYMFGQVSHPELYNYAHHPYPILWIYTALQSFGGDWAVEGFVALLGLIGTGLTFSILCRWTSPIPAWMASVLFAVAPASVFFDIDPNVVALGTLTWPLTVWILLFWSPRSRVLALGCAAFASVQISWFSFTLLPALLVLSKDPERTWLDETLHPFRNPLWLALITGFTVSGALFLLQLILYTPHLQADFTYLAGQAALHSSNPSRWVVLPRIVLRSLVLAGPALALGGLSAISLLLRYRCPPAWCGAFALYFSTFFMTGLALAHFFHQERSMYEYLVFPAACLTAWWLHAFKRKWSVSALVILAILGGIYVQTQTSIPRISEASQRIGTFLGRTTNRDDVILSNLHRQSPPFESWDVACLESTSAVANRLVRFDCDRRSRLEAAVATAPNASICFLWNRNEPLDPEVADFLRGSVVPITKYLARIPSSPPPFSLRLRSLYWKMLGLHSAPPAEPSMEKTRVIELELYRLNVPPDGNQSHGFGTHLHASSPS